MGDAKQPNKLFRAIVILGAALTTGPGCDESRCASCIPPDTAPDVAVVDAGVTDMPVDVILIL